MKILTACEVRCHECGTTRRLELGQITLDNIECEHNQAHAVELTAENVDVVETEVAV